jgi:hypothetical protein
VLEGAEPEELEGVELEGLVLEGLLLEGDELKEEFELPLVEADPPPPHAASVAAAPAQRVRLATQRVEDEFDDGSLENMDVLRQSPWRLLYMGLQSVRPVDEWQLPLAVIGNLQRKFIEAKKKTYLRIVFVCRLSHLSL